MAQANENLIGKVSQAMVIHKPSLAKYLIADDEDPAGAPDMRMLADMIIRNFPWPLGVELRRLFSASMRQLERGRLDQLFKTIERTMQFISFVMLAQLWEEKLKKGFEIPKEYSDQFKNRMNVLSLGNYTWLIRATGNLYEKFEIEPFMPEMKNLFNKKFYDALDFWVPERNEISHYQINLTDEDTQRRCVEYEDKLTFILENLSFIVKYKLVTVRDIKVLKHKHQEPRFNHVMDLLNSFDSDFKATEITYTAFADSNAVLLMKDFKDPHEFLNLSPLIIDTRPEIIDTKEKFNLKKDVFMYTKFNGDKLMYVGTEVTEKCDLTTLNNYLVLVDQFKELLIAFSSPEIKA
ncbi:MAG TPA: hypothetical protein VK783_06975 [Bacteroidia bacterium]|jgi:hypothetical protein|nr:hypothetical protein [Bacteroidia bacterium]